MRFGIDIPNFFDFADPDTVVRLASEAEANGWEGFFVWDHINLFQTWTGPMADPWILLAAIAQATDRIKLGPLVTPLPRRRPWKVARETVTLDHLSHGRLVFGAGLGFPPETEYAAFGEHPDLARRAAMLDEGLQVLTGLWCAEPFEYQGRFYTVERTTFAPAPVQKPRIPIWIGGTWPKAGVVKRAARWDGFVPMILLPNGEPAPIEPQDVAEMTERVSELREGQGPDELFEMVVSDEVVELAPRDRGKLRALEAAGATWWLEVLSTRHLPMEAMFERIRQGPPVL